MTLTRDGIAYRVARDLPQGAYVNLGIGIPILVANYLSSEQDIFLHSENGILGVGPRAKPGEEDPDLISAGKGHCTLAAGASLFDQALSFTMMRGGHLTHAVMGGIEVAQNGDFANWRTPGEAVPGVGGAMDLAVGVPHVFVAMNHVNNQGQPKIVTTCTCPLTARRVVERIYTDMALIEVTPDGLVLREVAPGLDAAAVQAKTDAPLRVAADCRAMDVPESRNGVPLRK
jgi:3-oxoacid CoA-transferase B subunit